MVLSVPPPECRDRALGQFFFFFFFSLHSTLKTTKRNSLHKWKEPEMRGQKPEEPLGKVL